MQEEIKEMGIRIWRKRTQGWQGLDFNYDLGSDSSGAIISCKERERELTSVVPWEL